MSKKQSKLPAIISGKSSSEIQVYVSNLPKLADGKVKSATMEDIKKSDSIRRVNESFPELIRALCAKFINSIGSKLDPDILHEELATNWKQYKYLDMVRCFRFVIEGHYGETFNASLATILQWLGKYDQQRSIEAEQFNVTHKEKGERLKRREAISLSQMDLDILKPKTKD